MRRAVVIGATGQIGRVAVRALAGDGWEVTAVSRGGGRDESWPEEVRVAAADRADDAALAAAVGDDCDAIAVTIATLPEQLRRSLTWDQGAEMAQHVQLRIDAGLEVYFADPHSPWQRGTNENTNGLLRQYFPKGTDLSRHTHSDLDAVALALNNRPRKTLGWKTPGEAFSEQLRLLTGSVATTP